MESINHSSKIATGGTHYAWMMYIVPFVVTGGVVCLAGWWHIGDGGIGVVVAANVGRGDNVPALGGRRQRGRSSIIRVERCSGRRRRVAACRRRPLAVVRRATVGGRQDRARRTAREPAGRVS